MVVCVNSLSSALIKEHLFFSTAQAKMALVQLKMAILLLQYLPLSSVAEPVLRMLVSHRRITFLLPYSAPLLPPSLPGSVPV